MMMENKLEEIRKRAAEYDPDDPPDNYVFHMMACSDRRWLLGEVDAQREELGRLIREQAVLKDEDNRLLHEVDRLMEEIERLREALDFYANSVNWWWDSERNSWIWMGDNHPDMTAHRVLDKEGGDGHN